MALVDPTRAANEYPNTDFWDVYVAATGEPLRFHRGDRVPSIPAADAEDAVRMAHIIFGGLLPHADERLVAVFDPGPMMAYLRDKLPKG